MSAPSLTPDQEAASRSLGAAVLIVEAKQKEHEAACVLGDSRDVERARNAVLAATEAVMDARERLFRLVFWPRGVG